MINSTKIASTTTGAPSRRRFLLAVAAGITATMVLGSPATAQSLNELRAAGKVGERFDGFLQARSNDSASRSAVKSVNAKRRTIYSKRAAEQGVSADQVGRVYAQQIFRKAPSGTYFLQENGKWVRK